MNPEEFILMMNDLPDKMLVSALRKKPLITRHWAKIAAAAACFLLIAGGTFVLTRKGSTPRESIMNEQSLAAEVTEIAAVTETTAETLAASQTTAKTTATTAVSEEGKSEPAAVTALTVPAMPETTEAAPAETQPASVQTTVTAADITTTAETTITAEETTTTEISLPFVIVNPELPEVSAQIYQNGSRRSLDDLRAEDIYQWLQDLGTPKVEVCRMRQTYFLTNWSDPDKLTLTLSFSKSQCMTVYDAAAGEARTRDGIKSLAIRKMDGAYYIIFFSESSYFDDGFTVVKLLNTPTSPLYGE